MSLLGVDIGATGCKAAAYTPEGVLRAQAARAWEPVARRDGMRELDTREVWAAVRDVIARVAAQTVADPVQALCVTSVAEAVTAISADGLPLSQCLLGCDAAPRSYMEQVRAKLGDQRLFDITGHSVTPGCVLSTLAYLRDRLPEVYAAAWRILPWSSLATTLLGGRPLIDYSLANRTLLYDMQQRRWSRPVLDAAGLGESRLPEVAPAGTPVGTLSPALARELGLPARTRLVLGGHAPCCTALGAGVTRPELALYDLGASLRLVVTFAALPLTSMMLGRGLSLSYHVLPELYVSLISTGAGGALLKWFRDQWAAQEAREAQRRGASIYDALLTEMPDDPTSLLVLPHWAPPGPPVADPDASGAIMGLRLGTTRGEVLKALLEGASLYMAQGLAHYLEMGVRVDWLRATGGAARSMPWLQLTADVLGVPVELPEVTEATTLGAALLAGLGSGAYGNAEEAVRASVRVRRRFQPNASRHAQYDDRLARYSELDAWWRSHAAR
ncbi:MAG: hypothetical protein GX557_16420 [Chloroflexi bacterium]|nr:hypothetical protein [Chloroflexota bacterium]